ncbi:serine/threonine-protein kinase HipA [Neomicrococcus aestuarii]|uniref:Serine/threonine-protein kinase HipA n=1 Tax=Neomicrococcus aestuarii TaxID=556325 RepID=A0A7W8TTK1_9MICC|nr:HipA domain-containing protein [Neomicrococcus aestuarii]MBB5512594.1 serine/threonine-protein kinase HipA [Neomicrococcus aestuarii]
MGENVAGILSIESEALSPLEHLVFSYADSWLAHEDSFAISPELPLERGPQRPTMGREMFGSFMDAAPDAWGQRLLFEEARLLAKESGTPMPRSSQVARLLMVNDQTRQGALRFREDGQFLSTSNRWAGVRDLHELAAQARAYEESGYIDEVNSLLIGAGSSPGGAQPKAWVRDDNGTMHLAKFPKSSDSHNVQLWEMVAIRLQERAGIRVQPSKLVRLDEHHQIFLTQRFDRADKERRIPYMSVRTALQLADHEHRSYVTLAREIAMISSDPVADANEVFNRAAFGALVNNIDDHMRNHGLLRHGKGWRLSPSFDVNPMRSGASNTPLVPEGDTVDRNVLELLEHLDSFRLTRPEAIDRLQSINKAVSHWASEAANLGAESDEIEPMKRAFEGPSRGRIEGLDDGLGARVIDLRSGPKS